MRSSPEGDVGEMVPAPHGRDRSGAVVTAVAAIGVVLVALVVGGMGYFFDGYWLEPVGAVLLVIGAGRLLRRGRWEGNAVGGCCWLSALLLFLEPYGIFARSYAISFEAGPVVLSTAYAITLAANAWDAVKWLWGLPMPRPRVAVILCSLSAAALLMARPYWVARYRGRDAHLRKAVLLMGYLDGADLRGADLSGANLSGAWLGRANLEGADLQGAKLWGVVYTGKTKWPDGFDPAAHGARMALWQDEDDGD